VKGQIGARKGKSNGEKMVTLGSGHRQLNPGVGVPFFKVLFCKDQADLQRPGGAGMDPIR